MMDEVLERGRQTKSTSGCGDSHYDFKGVFLTQQGTFRPPAVSEEIVKKVRDSYLRCPKKSTRRCSQELQLPQRTVCKILRKRLRSTLYKLQLVPKLYPRNKEARFEFYHIVQEPMENDPDLLLKIIFSDDATFHRSGKVIRHSMRIWGTQNPHTTLEFERNSLKVNVFCAITERTVYGPFSLKDYPSLALLWP
ncbi:hypothetical protein PoB_004795700 [Plakobranchus ocellatus]|uniref:Transposase Tc1-like domain-containing protein n=1 Tax=Plakobranchus ocellatus TaxID=259542 RepID=A0AAV4BR49_9GAST|nr:hypothetical protein PoB_004795700 [Plakobranchus ocellatus]